MACQDGENGNSSHDPQPATLPPSQFHPSHSPLFFVLLLLYSVHQILNTSFSPSSTLIPSSLSVCFLSIP
ncbi:hypothetical protein A0H81_01291 [Grifola frondosa]|uniref:Uncharacterized protein n=1 Tax=Grifola frondosa TaxID=5627 RepID=A0A1C7MR73_GRIFR|nr:hypothetical protein A0H81_01291 [Grifola frondosa]